ncbi:SURF1 family protein [Consotaella aegiceratis]|uniref:SURF1 family protein n=1 Tax=Consotaella aegiceratis TaxID=3097961 RepID=UPI002F417254
MSRARLWSILVLGLVVFVILCGLGTWQVQRLAWKEGLLDEIATRMASAPQPLAEINARYAETGDVDYWPVEVSGRFVHAGERYFLSTHDGEAGWNVYTPMMLDEGRAVFVNRGFVPYEMKDPATRPEGQIEGVVTVTGLARDGETEKPNSFVPDNDVRQNIFFWRSVSDMAEDLNLPGEVRITPFFIDAGPGAAPGGYPIGGTTIVDLPNDHLQYAITWFGLALVLVVMLVMLVVRRRRYDTLA